MPRLQLTIEDHSLDDLIVCSLDTNQNDDRPPSGPDDRTRHLVVVVTMSAIVAALSVSGAYGLLTRDWTPLNTVWLIAAAPFGAIIQRYVGELNAGQVASG